MGASRQRSIVVVDTSVLINLMHAGRLKLLGTLASFEFVVPDDVIAEITIPAQREDLDVAIARGDLRQESITDPNELVRYADLRRIMGRGEAACLALAEARGWIIASDEKKRFRQEVARRLGQQRLVTTAGLLVIAIRSGVISVEEADQAKAILERHRFRMPFGTFREFT